MNRHDYLALLDRIAVQGGDARLHWASGPKAGMSEPWDGVSEPPGTPVRGLGRACRETPEGCLFAEVLVGEPRLVVVGAGHVGVAVARIATLLGFHITVIDERPELADTARFPGVDAVVCGPYDEALAALPEYANTYVVLVTPGHRSDRACAAIALSRPFAYVGMIGSRGKVATVLESLRADGVPEDAIAQLHSPIGLPLGGREPGEIAVAIAAEMIQVRAASTSSHFDPEIARELRSLAAEPGRTVVLATVVGHGGSVPRGTGSRMLVGPDGRIAGSTGGGRVEGAAIERARQLLDAGGAVDLADYDLSSNEGAELGMICGGRVRIMFESL